VEAGVISDWELQRDVLNELEFDPGVNPAQIGVAVNKGVVTLAGFVTSFAEKLAAENVAHRVKGVTLTGEVEWPFQRTDAEQAVHKLTGVVDIINRIQIAAPMPSLEVAEKIERALQRSAELEARGISVRADGGKVVLNGKVRAWHERDLAERAAWSAPGVAAVENRLTVEPSPGSLSDA
jgi:osmotically-inducible protein OsmY